tara:strand:+ start:3925 stop:4905 length:981 start_codon:yes stop_codon:yes gene_type:complete
VVVIRLRSLGDTILITPALRLLKHFRPDLSITAVTERSFTPVLEGNPDISDIITVDRKWRSITTALAQIRGCRPVLCLNLHGGPSSAWMTAVSGAKFKAGFAHFQPAFLYNVRIPRAQQILGREDEHIVHTAEHHASAMFFLGVPKTTIPGAFLQATPDRSDMTYAVVHVGAKYSTKRWPANYFRALSHFLREDCQIEPIIVAGPEQEKLLENFTEFTCRKKLTLNQLKNLLAGAVLFVGNDSGPTHMAAALGVPSVVIFGSSNSSVWRPWKVRYEVIETDWDCKPCPGDRCYAFEEPRCILSVELKDVEAAISRLCTKETTGSKS